MTIQSKMRFRADYSYLPTMAPLTTSMITVIVIELFIGKAPWMPLYVFGDGR